MIEEYDDNKEKENKKKKRKSKKNLNEENEEEDEKKITIKIRKKKKRSKTTAKDRKKLDDNEDIEENENDEKPKKKKRRKKKKEEDEKEENEEGNEENENEEKPKKRKKKKRRKPQTDDENENENDNNEDNDEEIKPKRRKKRKKRKEFDEDNENNEEKENDEENEEGGTIVKKKKKKKRKILEDALKDGGNPFDSKEVKAEFYKTAKSFIKKKKKKKVKKEENEENEKKDSTIENNTMPKLRTKKKKLLTDKIKANDNENEKESGNEENPNPNEDELFVDELKNTEENWPSIKKEFLTEIEKYCNEISLFEYIDIAIVSKITLSKKEYGDLKLTQHHDIYPIKNYNNINWAKDPYRKLKDKFYELAAPGNLISKNNYLDFSNRVCNEYEIYTASVQLFKISGNDITQKVSPDEYYFVPKEEDKIIKKPYLLLLFSFDDEKSILFYKEVLEYLKENENKNKFIFMPIYAPFIQAEKNILFVTEMLYRYKVYKKGDPFEIYFCANEGLTKRFKYISDDNKKTVTCKTVFIDVIDNKLVVRAVRNLDSFTFNLVDSKKEINKQKHKNIVKNLQIFKKNAKTKLKNTSLKEPYNCNLLLQKVKIYSISKAEKKLRKKYTLYDSLTGNINCHNIYKSEDENLKQLLKELFYYKLRANPKNFKLNKKQINKLIIEEMQESLKSNDKIKNITYKGIFQTQKIIMSLGSNFDINQKFEPIKSKSFKLEVHLNIKLFAELNPMNLIGSLYSLTLFSYFNNCDYIACLPKIGSTFPNILSLTDNETLKDMQIPLNPDENKPSLLVIFSLAFQNYFASSELSSRFKLIIKKLSSFYEKEYINIILIYRGEPSLFKQRFEQIKDDPIFDFNFPLYIKSSADMKFPLVFQNNDIESTDSQIMAYILNKNNTLVYTGNLEDIELDKTFQKLCDDTSGEIENILVYKEHANLPYNEFKKMIKPEIKKIEEIIEEEIKNDNVLLYRPFFSLSYNTYTNFENDKTDNERYINHIRLRILVKERHENIFTNNKDFKNIINNLKKYGASTIVTSIPCEDIDFMYHCENCQQKLLEINENNPIYYDEESKKIFCEKCGEDYSKDIKNDTFVTFFNTQKYNDEVISEIYEIYNKRSVSINPVLGNICKICQNKIGDCYFLNLTHFNIDYIESPLTPIDICESCFYAMRNGDPFLNEPLKRLNYEKFGLNYKHMVYRKIYIPLTGQMN